MMIHRPGAIRPGVGVAGGRGFCVNHKRTGRAHGRLRDLRHRRPVEEGADHHPRRDRPTAAGPGQTRLLGRGAGQRTCGDIAYVPTDEGWMYLADVLDLGS